MADEQVADWRRALVFTAVFIACLVSAVGIFACRLAQFVPFYLIPVMVAIPLLSRRDGTCRTWCLAVGTGQAIMDADLPLGVFSGLDWYLPSTLLLIAAGLGQSRSRRAGRGAGDKRRRSGDG